MASKILEKIYRKDPETICRIVDEERVIIPLRSDVDVTDLGAFYILKNPAASHIWDLIDGKRSVEKIVACVLDRFQVQPKRAETDTVRFIEELEDIKAIA